MPHFSDTLGLQKMVRDAQQRLDAEHSKLALVDHLKQLNEQHEVMKAGAQGADGEHTTDHRHVLSDEEVGIVREAQEKAVEESEVNPDRRWE